MAQGAKGREALRHRGQDSRYEAHDTRWFGQRSPFFQRLNFKWLF